MSRCFPFPPPGYETKARSDHVDLLGKEKHKEKKHRKEKKDREKKEGKERKDKDRSKEKNREKKDRKEKHRDKKKDKDRDKDKKKISNDRRIEDHTEGQNGEVGENSRKAENIKDSKFTEELGRRIRDEERAEGNQMAENITGKFQRRNEGTASSAEKERGTGTEMVQNFTVTEPRRVGVAHANPCSAEKERGTGNKMVQNLTVTEPRRVGVAGAKEGGTGDEMVHNFNKAEQRSDGMDRPMEKEANKNIERKDKTKEREADAKRGDSRKNRDREKKHKRKDKDRENEKEKEEKTKEKGEHKYKDLGKLRDSGKKEHIDTLDVRPLFPPKDSKRDTGNDGNLKRKEVNGFLHENDLRPNKLLRPASSSQPPVENGRKLDLYCIATARASDKHEAVNNLKVEKVPDNKEHKINGISLAQPPLVTLGPSLIADATENGEASMKLPHPDQKYLSQIYSIPKMEEWPETDEQEWLFSRDDLRQKPKTKFEADETPQVWSGALQIESADVLALPYVIPY